MKMAFPVRLSSIVCAAFALVVLDPVPARPAGAFTLESARAAAAKGDAPAMYFLAKSYAKGEGVSRDLTNAAEYMRQSAELGHAFAQTDLAAMYSEGEGVKQDYEEAARWYRKAAGNGDALAEYGLGLAYALGRGVPKDVAESVKWYQRAADHGQTDALLALGDVYLNGREDIPVDLKRAFRLFQKAATLGRFEALNSVGFLYENGGGLDDQGSPIDPSPELAVKCYREAALKGDARGQENLGRMYLEGEGVKTDLVEAYKWFSLARRNGELTADKYLQDFEIAQLLKPAEKAEAIHRADEFQKSFAKEKAAK
jgi:TPR repeat protein